MDTSNGEQAKYVSENTLIPGQWAKAQPSSQGLGGEGPED